MRQVFKITESDYLMHRDEYNGICLLCGEIRWGETEPDAENYPCDACGKSSVQGIDNALVCGDIEII